MTNTRLFGLPDRELKTTSVVVLLNSCDKLCGFFDCEILLDLFFCEAVCYFIPILNGYIKRKS